MERAKSPDIQKDLETKKIILIAGPRQAGKTTVSKSLTGSFSYLNYDLESDQKIIKKNEWDQKTDLVIFDELHKMKKWKSWIKGIYDTQKTNQRLLITGSARLDIYRKGGDSLAGRHFLHRLYPFTVKELKAQMPPKDVLERILSVGGFPEPFLENQLEFASRWRRSHLDVILRQDLLDLEKVREIKSIEILISLLRERIGSTVSYSSLAQELSVSGHTIKHWLQILENLYIIFRVTPFSKNLARSISHEPKYYFYDTGAVENGNPAKLENAIACALWTDLHYLEDRTGAYTNLHFVRDKEQNEVDFLVVINKKPKLLAEVKWNDDHFAKSLFNFRDRLKIPDLPTLQVVHGLSQNKTKNGVQMLSALEFLENLHF